MALTPPWRSVRYRQRQTAVNAESREHLKALKLVLHRATEAVQPRCTRSMPNLLRDAPQSPVGFGHSATRVAVAESLIATALF